MSSLPESIESAREAYSAGSQYLEQVPKESQSPPKYSKPHLARSRSSGPSHTAPNKLEAYSLNSSPLGFSWELHSSSPLEVAQDRSNDFSPPSSPAESQQPRFRSDSVQNELAVSNLSSKLQSLEPLNYPIEVESAVYLPPGFKFLPKTCYNYQTYVPPPPPAVLPWSRKQLYNTIVNSSPPIFLSCNWTNPVHLASIIAPWGTWSDTEIIASGMTPATSHELVEDLRAWKSVEGVLVSGLAPQIMAELEHRMKSKYDERYDRRVGEVTVQIDDGQLINLAAYVYQKARYSSKVTL